MQDGFIGLAEALHELSEEEAELAALQAARSGRALASRLHVAKGRPNKAEREIASDPVVSEVVQRNLRRWGVAS